MPKLPAKLSHYLLMIVAGRLPILIVLALLFKDIERFFTKDIALVYFMLSYAHRVIPVFSLGRLKSSSSLFPHTQSHLSNITY